MKDHAVHVVANKVDAPAVPRIPRSKPDQGAVLMIQPFPFLMAMGQLQFFFSPQAFDFFDLPASL